VELVLDSLLLFGRVSLGATIGLVLGTLTQGERHVRWSLAWMLAGYAAGVASLASNGAIAVIAGVVLFAPSALGAFGGFLIGAGTLGDREDWYLRAWAWAGFVASFHALAIAAMAVVNAID
jgi:hypothetical protein